MARKGGTPNGLIAGLVMLVVVAAVGAFFWMQSRKAAEAPPPPPPTLPEGRLQVLSSGVTEVRYLALDESRQDETGAVATVLVVSKSPTGADRKYALLRRNAVINCAARRTHDETAAYFDAYGRLVHSETINTGRMGRPMEPGEVEGDAVCGRRASGHIVQGWRVAQRQTQAPPEGLLARAEANPGDVHAWAWLCSASARGHTRDGGIAACDRALELQPDLADVRIDRGYFLMMQGREPAAEADFRAILEKDPKNAFALYGRSLIAALAGQEGASRALRTQAFALDAKVSDWAESNYGLRIGAQYRAP